MTIRQQILKFFYPALTVIARLKGNKDKALPVADKERLPGKPFHELSFLRNDGDLVNLEMYKGKKLLLVNTASKVGS